MEVIKKGKKPEEMKVKFTCTKCHSVLSATKSEGKAQSDRDGAFHSFKCIVCSHVNYVDDRLFR